MALAYLPLFLKGQVVKGFGRGSKDLGCPTGKCSFYLTVLIDCYLTMIKHLYVFIFHYLFTFYTCQDIFSVISL